MKSVYAIIIVYPKRFQWFWSTFWKLCILAWDFAFAALRAIFQLKIGLEDEVGKGGTLLRKCCMAPLCCGWILNCVWYHYSDACTVSDIDNTFIRLCSAISNSESTIFWTNIQLLWTNNCFYFYFSSTYSNWEKFVEKIRDATWWKHLMNSL